MFEYLKYLGHLFLKILQNDMFVFNQTIEVWHFENESTIYKWSSNSYDEICITPEKNAELLAVATDDIFFKEHVDNF